MYINKKRVSLPDTAGVYLAHALMDLMENKPLEEIKELYNHRDIEK